MATMPLLIVHNVEAQPTPTPQQQSAEQDAHRFVISFNDMATVDEAHRLKVINDILTEFNSEGSLVRKTFNESYVVKLDPPVPADRVPELRGTLESKAEIHTADIDLFVRNIEPYSSAPQHFAGDAKPAYDNAPNDPRYRHQWHLYGENSANVEGAWDLGVTGRNVTIGVVDTDIVRHPDLDTTVLRGGDLISEDFIAYDGDGRDNDASDEGDWTEYEQCGRDVEGTDSSWHGSHVAGIAAAVKNNRTGVAGVAPEASIVPVRTLGACGGFESDIADALAWSAGGTVADMPANRNPADVVNMSLGSNERSSCTALYQSAINEANRLGAVVVVAAGNENETTSQRAPGNCNGITTVGATGPEGYRANYSNYGPHVDVGAPGGNSYPQGYRGPHNPAAGILSTVDRGRQGPRGADYALLDGTSMAAPVVSGVVALMLEANPNLSTSRIKRILADTAQQYEQEPTNPNHGNDADKTRYGMGAGIVDAEAAVCAAINSGGGNCQL